MAGKLAPFTGKLSVLPGPGLNGPVRSGVHCDDFSATSKIVPTNVGLDEIAALVAAGAAGFGVGSKLLDGADPRSATAIAARLRAAREAAGHPA